MRAFVLSVLAGPVLAGWVGPAAAQGEPASSRFPALGQEDAWKLLPREEPPLPAWRES